MTEIALLLLAAAAGFGVSRWLGIPAVPCLVLAGLIMSAFAPLPPEFLENALMLGIAFLVFVAGTELNPARVGRQRRAAVQVGVVQFVVLGGVGFAAARAMGFDTLTGAYVALALTASSTLVVVRVLQSRRQLFEPFGRMVLGVLLLQDVLVILLIPVVTRLPDGVMAVATGLGGTLGLFVLSGLCLRWVTRPLALKLARNEEGLLLTVLTVLFAFLALATLLDLPMIAGAFLAGLSLSPFPVSGLVRGQVQPIADFFSALFYTALGAFVTLPGGVAMVQAGVLAAVVLVLTPPLVALVAERSGFSARPAIFSGLLISQTSEFSLVVGLQGVVAGQLDNQVFAMIVLVTVFTMVLTPLLSTDRTTLALMRLHPSRLRKGSEHEPPSGHVLLLGCGANGMPLLETLVIGPYPVVAVDDDPAVVDRVREAGVPCIRGDAADPSVLREAGAGRARVVISTIRRAEDNQPLLAMASDIPVIVRGFNDEDGEWIRANGGRPVLYADAAERDFLDWFDSEGPHREAPEVAVE